MNLNPILSSFMCDLCSQVCDDPLLSADFQMLLCMNCSDESAVQELESEVVVQPITNCSICKHPNCEVTPFDVVMSQMESNTQSELYDCAWHYYGCHFNGTLLELEEHRSVCPHRICNSCGIERTVGDDHDCIRSLKSCLKSQENAIEELKNDVQRLQFEVLQKDAFIYSFCSALSQVSQTPDSEDDGLNNDSDPIIT